MLPFLQVGHLKFGMYGICILVGAIFGVGVALLRAKKRKFPLDDTIYLSLLAFVGLAVGAKVLYILTILPDIIANFQTIFSDPEQVAMLLSGGFVFYGGILGAVLAIWLYTRGFKMDFLESVEILIPSVPLIHAFGRVGCFCGGCCYGIPMDPPWGIAFTQALGAPNGIPLFPVQLLEAALNLLLFFFLLWFAWKPRPRGRVLGAYVAAYAVIRFILEYFRYDAERGIFWIFSTSQWISVILLPIGIWLLLRTPKEKKTETQEKSGEAEAQAEAKAGQE